MGEGKKIPVFDIALGEKERKYQRLFRHIFYWTR